MKKAEIVKISAGIVIAAAGILIFLKQVNVEEVLREVRNTPLWKMVSASVLAPVTLVFRAWRWKYLLAERSGSSKKGLFPLVAIGFMVNNVLPARIGEAARAALLWKRNRFTFAESVGSLLVERFLDVMVFTFFTIIPVFLLPRLEPYRSVGKLLTFGMGSIIVCFICYSKYPEFTKRIVKKMIAGLPQRFRRRVVTICKELVSNLDWLFSSKKTVIVALLSIITQACQAATLHVLGWGIEGFNMAVSMFGVSFAALGAAIPGAPGYIGTLHSMMVSGLVAAGIASDTAGAIAVLFHAIGYITISVTGIYYFISLKISMKDIKENEIDKKE